MVQLLSICPRCSRGFTAQLWAGLRLQGHARSFGRLLEFRRCACGEPCEAVVNASLVVGCRLDLVATEELPRLAACVGAVVASSPGGTPHVQYAAAFERLFRAELHRRLGEEAARARG